ncbi:MAG: S46 family peptidase [Holophagaceae bacterium]|nr:S46 family peptidase [Holophagaceae bacterium]
MRLRTLALLSLLAATLRADEGMWTFDNVPKAKIKAAYGFEPSDAFLDHLRLSSLRFPGATGAFVSAEGLVLTNHHVGLGAVQQVSAKGSDFVKNGFLARTRAEELKIPGYELLLLESYQDVTTAVNAAVKPGMDDKAARTARENELARLQKAEAERTGLTVNPVTLYQGGEYWLYRYKKFTDVRLVMAPEEGIAFFGGDWDNFTWPRHDLDFTLFRVYENGAPHKPAHFLQVSAEGAKAGDLVFASGYPAATARQETFAQMAYARDRQLPLRLKSMARLRDALAAHGKTSEEARRLVGDQLRGLENNLKRQNGWLSGLKDAVAMARIQADEKALKAFVAKDPILAARSGQAWTKIEAATRREAALLKESTFVAARNSNLLVHALNLVRLADETAKPDDKRLNEFKEANLKATKTRLGSPKPLDPGVETALLAANLSEAKDELGAAHPFVQAMLGGKSPQEAAAAAVKGSKLADPAERKRLMEGGAKALADSTDPMLLLAKKLDPLNRKVRKQLEDEVQGVYTNMGGRIAEARFQAYGKTQYPDATFTLRLTYGAIATYPANGTQQQPFTTFAGLFDRAWGQGELAEDGAWALPPRWKSAAGKVELSTPFNFAYAADTTGGNSGSPLVNTKGELVGLNFDSNIEAQVGRYFYDGRTKRSIAVDARAILEALDKVYGAGHLAAELRMK